jgi:hypothetical protein
MRYTQPPVEERGVDMAEVEGVGRVAVFQSGQVGMGAVQAGLDGPTEQEDLGRGAVVGPAAAVLAQPPAELGEDQDRAPPASPDFSRSSSRWWFRDQDLAQVNRLPRLYR